MLIAGDCQGFISLTRLKGPANHSFKGFSLTCFPRIEREREGRAKDSCEAMNLCCKAENELMKLLRKLQSSL
jgi:hypothetical protein